MGYYGYLPFEWGYKAASWVRKSAALLWYCHESVSVHLVAILKQMLENSGNDHGVHNPTSEFEMWHPMASHLSLIGQDHLSLSVSAVPRSQKWRSMSGNWDAWNLWLSGLGGNTNRPLANWERHVRAGNQRKSRVYATKTRRLWFLHAKIKNAALIKIEKRLAGSVSSQNQNGPEWLTVRISHRQYHWKWQPQSSGQNN